MKRAIAMVLTVVFMVTAGCNESSWRGGSVKKGEGFRIIVPSFSLKVKQGEVREAIITVKREDYFKQDVKMEIIASAGVTVVPTDVLVKASDNPDVKLTITAAKDAAIGNYDIIINGTPKTGESVTAKLIVKVSGS